MLKTKIIAADITNLTDARYFAAWGVDYITFVGDPNSNRFIAPNQVKEIKDWLEGPTYAISYPGVDIDETVFEQLSVLEMDTYVLSRFINPSESINDALIIREIIEEDIKEQDEEILILKCEENTITTLKEHENFLSKNEVYLDGNFSKDEIVDLLEKYRIAGFVLRGGEEEKVGLKSFDELDEIMEALED